MALARVRRATVVCSRLAEVSSPTAPRLTGRAADRDRLGAVLRQVRDGLSAVLVVSGDEPGGGGGPPLAGEPPAGTAVISAFDLPSADGRPAFSGHVIHCWTVRSPAAEDTVIARMLVDHALEVVRYERLAERARAAACTRFPWTSCGRPHARPLTPQRSRLPLWRPSSARRAVARRYAFHRR